MTAKWSTVVGALFALLVVATSTVGGATAALDPGAPSWTEVQNPDAHTVDVPDDIEGPIAVMLELDEPATAVTYADERGKGRSKNDAGRAAKAQKARNDQAQAAIVKSLSGKKILFQTQVAYNGIALMAKRSDFAGLAQLDGVKAVHELPAVSRGTASAVPLMGAPQVWESFGNTGDGVSIAIIDTGVDYVHSGLGGRGTSADWAAAKSAAANPAAAGPTAPGFTVSSGGTQIFPSAKVIGGWDFAGDNYSASSPGAGIPFSPIPAPDPNPLDCGGHGSHVAGIAAGNGVKEDGSAYTGPYDTSVPFGSMRIGPGMAPRAKIYAIRVFGCAGNTSLTVAGLNRAVDPNQDGDPSDHVDIINMSLGSDYGTPDDPSATASTNASLAGVIVANSAGNASDQYYVSGSPASSPLATTVASTADEVDVTDGFRVEAPVAIAGVYGGSRSVSYPWLATTFGAGVTPVPVTANLYYPPNTGTGTANLQYGCVAYTAFEAAKIAGKILVVDWRKPGDATFACGSAARANVATAAGAKGIIMVDSTPFLDSSIAGNDKIPAIYTVSTVGDALKSQLTPGAQSSVSVTLGPEFINTGKIVTPGRNDTIAPSTSRGPSGRTNALKPDLGAVGVGVFAPDVGTLNKGTSKSGTSMAAPHVAGAMAVLKNAHPGWTPAQLKAVLMNTATNDLYEGLNKTGNKYGVGRVGAGRIDVPAAVASQVIAYDAAKPGVVSVSFGTLEVLGSVTMERVIEVANKGATDVTYSIAYDPRTSIPGVSYSFPDGSSLAVPAGGTATFRVQLDADASQMKNTRDATVLGVQGLNPRQWLSEAGGIVTLTPASGQPLRVPIYANARPSSQMTTAQGALAFPGVAGTTSLTLTGTGVNTGTTPGLDYKSLVSAFELAHQSPKLAALPGGATESARHADLRYLGVTSNAKSTAVSAAGRKLYFALGMWDDWTTLPTEVGITVNIDTGGTSAPEFQAFQTRFTDTDVWVTAMNKLGTTPLVQTVEFTNVFNSNVPTAAFNNNVAILPISIAALGLPSGTSRVRYWVTTSSRFWGPIDAAGSQAAPLTYDVLNPGIDFTGGTATPLTEDLPGGAVSAKLDLPSYTANSSQGALLLHHFNTKGNRVQLLDVVSASAVTVAPASTQYSDPVKLAATVAAGYGAAPAGTVEFLVGGVSVGSSSVGSDGSASLTIPNLRSPGSYEVRAVFTSTTPGLAGNVGLGTLVVSPEDAAVGYSGPLFVSTPSTTSTTAVVNLVAQIRDITAVLATSDPNGGDIRTATVEFVHRDAGTTLCSSAVTLTGSDTLNGIAGCAFTASLGASNSTSYTVGIKVGGNYLRNDPGDNVVLTVSKPLGDEFVTGGGYLVNPATSTGTAAGTVGERTSFGFNAKYKKNGTAQGSLNVLVRSGGRTYQVKSHVIESLTAQAVTGVSTMIAKANISDITDPLAPFSIEGNATFQMTFTDRGEPGSGDTLGIAIWTSTGVLWFSSSWDGSRTLEQLLGGGNLVVH